METSGYLLNFPSELLRDTRLTPGAKILYAQIMLFNLIENNNIPHIKFLASINNVDARTIRRWKTQLKECGYLRSEE